MATLHKIRSNPTTRPIVRKAAFGALLGPALQIGQTIGEMMPDNTGGDIVKGIVNPIAGISMVGDLLAGRHPRKDAKAAEEAAKAEAEKAFFANRKIADQSEADMMKTGNRTISYYPYGGKLTSQDLVANRANQSAETIPFSQGETIGSPYNPASGVKSGSRSQTITAPNGSTQGSHETGANVPIVKDGQTVAIAEPGEEIVNNADGTADILSKRLGIAQKYRQVEDMFQRINKMIQSTVDPIEQNGLKRKLAQLEVQKQILQREQQEIDAQMEASGQQEMVDPQQAQEGVPMATYGKTLEGDPRKKVSRYDPTSPYMLDNPNSYPQGVDNPWQTLYDNRGSVGDHGEGYYDNPAMRGQAPTSISRKGKGVAHITPMTPKAVTIDPNAGTQPITPITSPTLKTGLTTTVDMPPKPKFGEGFDLEKGLGIASTVAQYALPIISNIKAKKKMDEMMKDINAYKPNLNKVNRTPYKTETGDQIAGIDSQYAHNISFAEKAANPLIAAAIAGEAGQNRISNRNQVFAGAVNQDMRMKAMTDNMANQTSAMNTQMLNASDEMKLNAKLGMNAQEIALNNQTVTNIQNMIREQNQKGFDTTSVELAMKYLNNNGVLTRNHADILERWAKQHNLGLDLSSIKVQE